MNTERHLHVCLLCCFLVTALTVRAEIESPDISDAGSVKTSDKKSSGSQVEPEKAAVNKPLRLKVDMADGSSILGTPSVESLPFKTDFADIKVAMNLLDSIEFSPDRKTMTVRFLNGDKLEGNTSADKIEMKTILGKISMPMKYILGIRIISGGAAADIPKGCVLYYDFDGEEQGKATDKSGKGNHGKTFGKTRLTEDRHGHPNGAYAFDGGDDRIETKLTSLPMGPDDDATISLWWQGEGNVHHKFLFYKYSKDETEHGLCFLTLVADAVGPMYYLPVMLHHYIKFKASLSQKNWNHVVLVKKKKDWEVYQNGMATSVHDSRNMPTGQDLTTDTPFCIGGSGNMTDYTFEGKIDDVMVFVRALSAEEIAELYKSRK